MDYIPSAQELCEYVGLCNLIDKRRGRAHLVNLDDINRWGLSLRGRVDYSNIYHAHCSRWGRSREVFSKTFYAPILNDFSKLSRHHSDLIHKLFEVTNGKMSLCGGAILNHIMRDPINIYYQNPNDYDFFFHCNNVQEADSMLKLCMETIAEYFDNDPHKRFIRYSRSEGVQTVTFNDFKLQFIRRNYQDISQVVLGFDLPCCQYGYNLIDGFFATIPGAMAFATGWFALDLTQRSLSFGHRLLKYLSRGFAVLLPGINPGDIEAQLETPDGRFISVGNKLTFELLNNHHHYTNPDHNGDLPLDSDYEGRCKLNWYYLATHKYGNVTFYTNNWPDLYDMDSKDIYDSIFRRTDFDKVKNIKDITISKAALFLQEKIVDFSLAMSQRKVKLALSMWEDKITEYHTKAVEIYNNINNPENSWRYKNPGGQDFGKLNPLITNPREWYGDNYKPVIIGISDYRFTAFKEVCMKTGFQIPTEIFKILCDWWLVAEDTNAKNKLFSIFSNTPLKISPVPTIKGTHQDPRHYAQFNNEDLPTPIYNNDPSLYQERGAIPSLSSILRVTNNQNNILEPVIPCANRQSSNYIPNIKMSPLNIHVPIINTSPKIPIINTSPKIPIINTSPKIPIINTSPKIPIINSSPKIPIINTSPKIPIINSSAKLPFINNSMPQISTFNNAVSKGPISNGYQHEIPLINNQTIKDDIPNLGLNTSQIKLIINDPIPKVPIVNNKYVSRPLSQDIPLNQSKNIQQHPVLVKTMTPLPSSLVNNLPQIPVMKYPNFTSNKL